MPLDNTFEDDRFALNFSWNQALSSKAGLTRGSNVSNEYDYLSIGASSPFDYALNKKTRRSAQAFPIHWIRSNR